MLLISPHNLPACLPAPICRLMQRDAAALAGQHAKWEAPDKFERVTRSEYVDASG